MPDLNRQISILKLTVTGITMLGILFSILVIGSIISDSMIQLDEMSFENPISIYMIINRLKPSFRVEEKSKHFVHLINSFL